MLGWVNYCKGQDYFTNAKFYLKRADEVNTFSKFSDGKFNLINNNN
jgi:hypothetical protein